MIFRMLVHSAIFTVAIAVGAVVMNGAGMLDSAKPGKSKWSSSAYGAKSSYRFKWDDHDDDDDHRRKRKRRDHDDD